MGRGMGNGEKWWLGKGGGEGAKRENAEGRREGRGLRERRRWGRLKRNWREMGGADVGLKR